MRWAAAAGLSAALAATPLLAACALLVGCDSGSGSSSTRASTRGPANPGHTDHQPGDRPLPGNPPPPSGPRSPRPPDPPARPAAQADGDGAEPAEANEEDEEESEDDRLTRALEQAFGTPTDCLSDDTRDNLGSSLTVNVRVSALPSGRVGDANVSGAGLGAEDLACMTRHAEALRLPGPIEGAPRPVTAQIRYQVQDTRVTRTERGAAYTTYNPNAGEPRFAPGHQPAGSALPAAGTVEDRPAGAVAPDSTLPAQAEPGPAPGYVPPGSTLPAIAE